MLHLLNPRFNPETNLEGAACYSIAAQLPRGGEQEVWIEKDSLLLRKVARSNELALSEEVRENIRVNEPLESPLFAA